MERYLAWESKVLKRLKKRPVSSLFIFLGIVFLVFGFTNYYSVRRLSFYETPQTAIASSENLDVPVEIIIPSINVGLPVDPGVIENGIWQVSANNATYLATSSPPGSGGNTVIYGHNLKKTFGNLPYLSVGQNITVKTKSGKLHNYVVMDKYFVGPDRVDLVSPSNTPQLTLYTCWGLFDTQRAVIKAIPSEVK